MAGTLKRLAGPAYFGGSAADVLTTPNALLYNVIRHIHVANKTTAAATFTLYLGGSAGSTGGTELFAAVTVPANGTYDYYCALKQVNTEYISGLASAGTTLVVTIEGEQYAV